MSYALGLIEVKGFASAIYIADIALKTVKLFWKILKTLKVADYIW